MDSTNPTPPEESQADPDADADALERTDTENAEAEKATTPVAPVAPPKKGGIMGIVKRFNIYLMLFLFVLTIAVAVIIVAYFQSQKGTTKATVTTQDLNQAALDQLANSDASVGDPKQLLNVQSNAVFAGQVLVRGSAEIAGGLQVTGSTVLVNLTTSGPAVFDQAQVNKTLSVAGDTTIQGSLAIQKGIQVNGGGSFSGPVTATQITTNAFQLAGDLTLTSHVVAGGSTPTRVNGPALGSGGTTSVSGSDTSGTLAVNTGSGPSAGCFATITFARKYNAVPHITVTPVGSDAGGLAYYITRTATTFSICSASPAPAGSSFAFDYFVVE
ncbi:MAG: hypothetical protein JWM81_404 [Candidatus Saccharibacteria bacterium]|nr:hypothetical protein [Candidatus Saccharibacteria bacterium]